LYRINITGHESVIRAYLESKIANDQEMQRYTSRDPNLSEDIVKNLLIMADGM